jgi:hypothetical protein
VPEIVAVRLKLADDGAHEHVDLLGYHSTHLKTEPVMVAPQRIRDNAILGESYWVTANGERAEIIFKECPVCGLEPYPRTSLDSGDVEHLKELPQK